MPGHHVDQAIIKVWRWEYLFWLLFALIAIAVIVLLHLQTGWPTVPLGCAVIAIIGLIATWYWPIVRYAHLTYDVDEFGLTIHDGVWWRDQSALPRARIQHSDVSQGPLQRRYGLATLTLYTAGSRYTKIVLDGLRHDDALELRDSLISRTHGGV